MPPTSSEGASTSSSVFTDSHFWHSLFSPDGYMPRRICGIWTTGEIRLHNFSDFFIWSAYIAIPFVLIYFVFRRKANLPFRSLFVLFGLFIISCGTTHFMEIVMFYYPVYRLAGLIKFFTAVISWATIAALVPALPRALAMRSPDDLEREVSARIEELQVLNAQKDELLLREQSARREAEIARSEAEHSREEAEFANKSKDEFLMMLSHELRTPLNTILGWSSLLRMGGLDKALETEALETIEHSCMNQTRLIDDILEVSRIVAGKMVLEMEPTDLNSIVSNAFLLVEAVAREKQIHMSLDVQNKPTMVQGDSMRLQQVVWNLLDNAIKFTPKGGTIQVTLRHSGNTAQIEIKDSGEGIAPDLLPHIFDRFRQADSSTTRAHGGLGLGLSIVRYLVDEHKGQISIESPGMDQGTTAILSLPLRNSVLASQPTVQPEVLTKTKVLQGLNILVVDDEADARRLVSMILTMNGAQTKVAGSASEGWDVLQEWPVDLLVSDVGMPRENGFEFLERIRRTPSSFQQVPALALTAYVSGDDRAKSREAGFASHLAKPILPDALLREITRLMGREK